MKAALIAALVTLPTAGWTQDANSPHAQEPGEFLIMKRDRKGDLGIDPLKPVCISWNRASQDPFEDERALEPIARELAGLGWTVVQSHCEQLIKLDFLHLTTVWKGKKTAFPVRPVLASLNDSGSLSEDEVRQKLKDGQSATGGFHVDLSNIGRTLNVAGSALDMAVVGNVIDMVGQATGAKAAFNNAVSGDPRGFCLGSSCKTWNHFHTYVQWSASYAGRTLVLNNHTAAEKPSLDRSFKLMWQDFIPALASKPSKDDSSALQAL